MAAVLAVVTAVTVGLTHRPVSHAETLAEWAISCNIDHFGPDDPIVYPGQPGVSHMHSFYSNKTTNAFSTTASLVAGQGSCDYISAFDHSAYWVPSVYMNNADNTSTQFTGTGQSLTVYYRRAGGPTGPLVHPFPVGLRMIAGDSHATGPQPLSVVSWDCSDGGPLYPSLPDCTNNSSGTIPVGFVDFPNCWDGVHLDSADHKSHMAYSDPNTGACPADHPVSLPMVGFEDWLHGTTGGPNFVLSSGGKYSMHGDFYAAWDSAMQNGLIANCMNQQQNSCHTIQYWQGGQVTINNGVNLFNINDFATPTPSPTGTPTAAQGDINGDGKVNVIDLSTLLSNWAKSTAGADLNNDGTVNVLDLSIMLSHWSG